MFISSSYLCMWFLLMLMLGGGTSTRCTIRHGPYILNAATVTHHDIKNYTQNSSYHSYTGQVQIQYKTWPHCVYTCRMTVVEDLETPVHVQQILNIRFPLHQTASTMGNADGCIYRGFACRLDVQLISNRDEF